MSKSGRPRRSAATRAHEAWARCVKCVNNPSHAWCYHTNQDLEPYDTTPINTQPTNRIPVIVNYPPRQLNPDQVSPTASSEESFESADDSPTRVPRVERQQNPRRLQPFNLPPPPPLEPSQQPILGQNAPVQDLSQHLERLRPPRTRQSTRLDYKALHTRGKKF